MGDGHRVSSSLSMLSSTTLSRMVLHISIGLMKSKSRRKWCAQRNDRQAFQHCCWSTREKKWEKSIVRSHFVQLPLSLLSFIPYRTTSQSCRQPNLKQFRLRNREKEGDIDGGEPNKPVRNLEKSFLHIGFTNDFQTASRCNKKQNCGSWFTML